MTLRVSVEDFRGIRDQVHAMCGVWLGDDKAYLVETRLSPLLSRFGLASFGDLRRALRAARGTDLRRAVVEALVTGETSWFRDAHPFHSLQELVLPALVQGDQKLRLWSAACSTGQEPYSLAIAALEFFAQRGGADRCRERIEIVATDLSEGALAIARSGTYADLHMRRGLDPHRRERYFQCEGSSWRVRDAVRSLVRFEQANLLEPLTPLGCFDAVFLRNVTIYFAEATKLAVLRKVASCIRPGGYLFLGATESLPQEVAPLRLVRHGKTSFYQRQA